MPGSLEEFARRLLESLEIYVEIQDLRKLGLSEEEIVGWLEEGIDQYLELKGIKKK